jgi:hypothetical protein
MVPWDWNYGVSADGHNWMVMHECEARCFGVQVCGMRLCCCYILYCERHVAGTRPLYCYVLLKPGY